MTTPITGNTKSELAAPASDAALPVVEAVLDLTQSAEVVASLEQLTRLGKEANDIALLADDGDNPEAESDKRRAHEAADTAAAGKRDILAVARRGDRAAVAGVIARSLNTARNAVSGVQEDVEMHEHSPSVSSSERVAHETSLKTKETAKATAKQKAANTTALNKLRGQLGGAGAAGVMAHADGDDDDDDLGEEKGGKPTKAPSFGVKREKDDTAVETLAKGGKRVVRKGKAAVRSGGVSIAERSGYISGKKADTAGQLTRRMENATTEEEYAEADRQWGKAVDRNVWGSSFVEQEIGDALGSLQGTKAARDIANNENWVSNDIGASQVVARLRANGYITGEKGWNWQHEKTSQWSHSAVKRIDRNGDGQLSETEIGYAMTHKYGVKPAPAPAAAPTITQAQVNRARDIVDTNNDGKVTQGEINAALKAAGVTLAQMDKDKNGAISNGELVAVAARLPRNYGAAPAKGK